MTSVMADPGTVTLLPPARRDDAEGMTRQQRTFEDAVGGLAIDLAGLHKSYGAIDAVAGVDLQVAPGEVVAILGPNGAGKSTTIDMLLGLTRPDSGTARLFGRPPQSAVAAGAVGAMLQTGGLIRNLSVEELVTVMASLYPHPMPVPEVLERTGLGHVAALATHKLSGGQTQRVRFALSLVSNPDLMVLDEPTVGLDVDGRYAFWAAVRGLAAQGRTVAFATHYLEEADAFADRIVLMARGRIVADASTSEIKGMATTRTIRATLPFVLPAELEQQPGVSRAERHGDTVSLYSPDSDAVLRAFLSEYPQARDIEVAGSGLDAAFRALTGDPGAEFTDALQEVH
jgi:ABC-2 type transport system ATP-binding protein